MYNKIVLLLIHTENKHSADYVPRCKWK